MKLMILGSSHRTHAVVWAACEANIDATPPVFEEIYVAGYNAGVEAYHPSVTMFECPKTPDELFCYMLDRGDPCTWVMVVDSENQILWAGDTFRDHGINVAAASLRTLGNTEGSKAHGSMLCDRAEVPTPLYLPLRAGDYEQGIEHIRRIFADDKKGCVVEFDGFAGGKGVTVCFSFEEAEAALRAILIDKKFGPPTYGPYWAVIEDLARGTEERSVLAATWGRYCEMLPITADYKRRFDLNGGPMTGSMGCTMNQADQDAGILGYYEVCLVDPILKELDLMGCPGSGFFFPGIMLSPTEDGDDCEEVLELNYRLPGPECLPIIMWYGGTFLYFVFRAAGVEPHERLPEAWGTVPEPEDLREDFVCVTLADAAYPNGKARGGDLIEGLDAFEGNPNVKIFFDGVVYGNGKFYTKVGAGRILFVVAKGPNPAEAYDLAYQVVAAIKFYNMAYRCDIGLKQKQAWIEANASGCLGA